MNKDMHENRNGSDPAPTCPHDLDLVRIPSPGGFLGYCAVCERAYELPALPA